MGCQIFTQTSPLFWGQSSHALLGSTEAAIVDVKFRCKVIRHLMSDAVSEMPILGAFGVALLNCT